MKTWTRLSVLPLLAFGAYACDEAASELTEADLAATAVMISQTLSDEQDGLMSSMVDATATVSGGQLSFGPRRKEVAGDAVAQHPGGPGMGGNPAHIGRGEERNVVATYDSVTGVHTVTFNRDITREGFSKSMSFVHKYIYKNEAGAFVRYPRVAGFASVAFDGVKSGSISGPRGTSNFERKGKFTLSGMQAAATELDYAGEFEGSGNHAFTNMDSVQVSRQMTFKYVLTNIKIAKSALTLEEPLSEGVTGTIAYNVVVKKTVNGETEENALEGTIELTGDGTALLQYLGHGRKFILNLGTGEARRRPM